MSPPRETSWKQQQNSITINTIDAGKHFDIDSLNEIKKASELASKKVEITNHIFEMLVNEIKDSLFPQRDEEEEIGLEDAL